MANANPSPDAASTLVICCGAIAREILGVVRNNGWDHMRVECLPAKWHNQPHRLPEGLRAKIRANRDRYDLILALYSDCGTGGGIQRVLDEEGIEGIGGAHCYEIFAGPGRFAEITRAEPGCFFVTDFLARHFEKLVFRGLGLDRHPQLRDMYFANYHKLVYLAQSQDDELVRRAATAADSIGLELEIRRTGSEGYRDFLARQPGLAPE